MNINKNENTNEAGYKNPPISGRFKKGQSGNPGGKRKGTRNLKTELEEELNSKMEIIENGKRRKITKRAAIIKSSIAKSIKGDVRATNTVLKLIADMIGLDAKTLDVKGISMKDKEILSLYLEQNGYERSAEAAHASPDHVEIDPSVRWMFDE